MRGTRSIISSNGPTVQLSSTVKACYCCGEMASKLGSLRISFEKHRPGFATWGEPPPLAVHLCVHCAGGIASSITQLITDEATSKKR